MVHTEPTNPSDLHAETYLALDQALVHPTDTNTETGFDSTSPESGILAARGNNEQY